MVPGVRAPHLLQSQAILPKVVVHINGRRAIVVHCHQLRSINCLEVQLQVVIIPLFLGRISGKSRPARADKRMHLSVAPCHGIQCYAVPLRGCGHEAAFRRRTHRGQELQREGCVRRLDNTRKEEPMLHKSDCCLDG